MSTRCMRLSGISTARRISRTPPTMVKQWTHRQVLSTRLHHRPLPDRSSTTPTAVLRRLRRVLVRPAEDFRGRWTGLLMDGDFARCFSLLSLSLSLSLSRLGPSPFFPPTDFQKGPLRIDMHLLLVEVDAPTCPRVCCPGTTRNTASCQRNNDVVIISPNHFRCHRVTFGDRCCVALDVGR